MALEYIAAYFSYLDYLAELSDAECGRLFKACLVYGKTGATPELRGNERYVWPGIKSQIDRDAEKYKRRCEKNSKNINIRWNTNEYERIPIDTKDTKEKEKAKAKEKAKEKEKDIQNIPPKSPQGETKPEDALAERKIPEPIKAELRKWFQYKKERREIYKPTGLLSFLSTVEKKCVMYGEEDIINLIEESMSNGWRGIIWERLSGKEKPAEKPIELPPDLIEAKKQHEEAMERFRAGEANWEDLIP